MLTKIVDGETVEMSPEEEAAILAEWQANAATQPAKQPSLVEKIISDPQQLLELKAALAKL